MPLCDAWLNRNVAQALAEIEDAVQAAKIQEYAAIRRRQTGTISPVLSAAYGVDGRMEAVGNAQALFQLPAVCRPENSGDGSLARKRGCLGTAKLRSVAYNVFGS